MTIVGKKKVKVDLNDGDWYNINCYPDIPDGRYLLNRQTGWIYDTKRRKLKFTMLSGGKKIVVEKGVTEYVNLVTESGKNKNFKLFELTTHTLYNADKYTENT